MPNATDLIMHGPLREVKLTSREGEEEEDDDETLALAVLHMVSCVVPSIQMVVGRLIPDKWTIPS